jgi:hypothetical protein
MATVPRRPGRPREAGDSGGNCLLGAMWLAVQHRTLQIRALWRGRWVPHLFVRTADGSYWHFRLVRDVLPHPLYYLWFRGRFERLTEQAFSKLVSG